MKKNDQRFLAYAVAFATSFAIIPGMASAADAAVNATSSDTATVNNTQAADQVAAENSVKNAKAAESAKDSQTDERTKEWNKNRPEESAVNDSLKQYVTEYTKNGRKYKVWIEDEKSLDAKLSLISEYNLAGAAYWKKGSETNSIWNMISNKLNVK